jgi:hypothetical protein
MSNRFDAASDRVSRAGGSPDPQTAFTICGWFYLSVNRADFSTLARIHASSGSTTRLTLATNTGGLRPAVFTPGNTGGVLAVDSFSVGAWLWVAVTQSSTTAIIYTCTSAGGTLNSASGTSSGGAAPDGYTFGGRSSSDASEWFNGRAAYVRLWSVVLNTTELAAERDSTVPVKTASLYADYPLTVFTDLTDHSGNARNLTAGSTSTTTEADPPLGTFVTDAPVGLRVGYPTDTTTFGVSAVDAPGGQRLGSPRELVTLGGAFTDAPTGVRVGSPAETVTQGGGLTDAPGGVRLGIPADSVTFGVTVTDPPGSARTGAPVEASSSGVTVVDVVHGARLGQPREAVTFGSTVADQPGHVRLGSPADSASAGLTYIDFPTAARLGYPGQAVTVGWAVVDAPTGLRFGSPADRVTFSTLTLADPGSLRLGFPRDEAATVIPPTRGDMTPTDRSTATATPTLRPLASMAPTGRVNATMGG